MVNKSSSMEVDVAICVINSCPSSIIHNSSYPGHSSAANNFQFIVYIYRMVLAIEQLPG